MNSKLFIALSLLLVCGTVYCQSSKAGKTVYRMTLEWPVDYFISYTNYTKRNITEWKGDNLAIGGFYPEYYTNESPCAESTKTCPHAPFDFSKITVADYKYLARYVDNYDTTTKDILEGYYNFDTCCYTKSQTQFFCDMTNIHKKFSIMKALAAKNIVPSKTRTYTAAQFQDALKGLFGGVKVVLNCGEHFENIGNDFKRTGYFTGLDLTLDENFNVTKESERVNRFVYCDPHMNFYLLPL